MKRNKKERARVRRWMPRVIVFYMIYLLLGALLPFAFHPKPSDKVKSDFQYVEYTGSSLSKDRAYVVEDNEEALAIRLAMFQQAKKEILFSTFDIRPGKSWDLIAAGLLEAAERGVNVRIVVDGMYGMLHMKKLPQFYAVGTHSNIAMKYYNPISLLRPWTINGRMHDKYILIDDKILLAGGRNTFDYFLQNKGRSISSDREVLVCHESGVSKDNVFAQTRFYFEEIWKLNSTKYQFEEMPLWGKEECISQRNAYQKSNYDRKPEKMDLMSMTIPVDKVSLLHNPTHIMNKEPVLFYQLTELMLHARKGITVQSPYANYSGYMYDRMKDVSDSVTGAEIIINSAAVGDNVMASSDYLVNREKVWATGFDVFEYFGSRSTHGKSILMDDHLSVIGSFNFDMRSSYLDTETMIVIDGKELQKQLAGHVGSLKEKALKVKSSDGSYIPTDKVEEIELEPEKRFLYRIIGPVIQPVRFLV